MRHILVTYTVKPGRQEENAALVRAVFEELAQTQPAGFRYAVFYRPDAREFIHLYTDEGSTTGVQVLDSFKAFADGAEDRHEQPATFAQPELIGDYRTFADPHRPAPVASAQDNGATTVGAIARARIDIHASPERVWAALTEPAQIAAYTQGSRVETTWQVGSSITWTGEYEGRAYQDKGKVLIYDEPHVLSVTHYSPLSGNDDQPDNYHTLVYRLLVEGDVTHLSLTQDNCADEAQAKRFSENWQEMLGGLKAHIES